AANTRRAQSFDIWKFTNEINETCTLAEKKEIIGEVWRVIYADRSLSAHEDYIAHKLGRLLNLTHPDLIEAKVKVLEELRQS
ncbi:MAG TPA: TerB family tellurite resistance protein, partial [Candidatus Hydrogenedentes bacterium]|nr:TerB family tellurite resistance protein [Candidatus Hydrogenedentota bacterium]